MKTLLEQLIQALRILPGVGQRSATRMAYYLLYQKKQEAKQLAEILQQSLIHIQHCTLCNTLCEQTTCDICLHPNRDASILCVVEMPIDVHTMEQTQSYKGLYFVLMGHLSPLDGIGPDDIAFAAFLKKAQQTHIKEIILATNFTTEGEATAYHLAQSLAKFDKIITRLAQGVPSGSELEYVDTHTIGRALLNRRLI